MKYLLEDTFDARAKWYFIGLYLNLPSSTLDTMKKDMNTSEESYTEVLKQWLQRGEATAKKLVDALESKTVNESSLVARLRQKYAKRIAAQKGIYIASTY